MEKNNIGNELKNTIHSTVDSIKSSVKDVKIPEIKVPEVKTPAQIKEALKKKENKMKEEQTESSEIKNLSAENAVKIIYYMMAADGEIFHNEEEKFDLICAEIDPDFAENKEQIISDCRKQLDKVIDPADYYDVLQEGIEEAIYYDSDSNTEKNCKVPSKLLIWDLLTIAYSDENYDETERKLLKYAVRKLNIDKSVFIEMENSILTLMDLEKELEWIKQTDRPYLTIETVVNEITNRKNVIFDSVKALIMM